MFPNTSCDTNGDTNSPLLIPPDFKLDLNIQKYNLLYTMMRSGYTYGTLDYKTDIIPTLGASHNPPHVEAIKEIQSRIDAEVHPIRTYFRKHIFNRKL